jgi:hypothetical protein
MPTIPPYNLRVPLDTDRPAGARQITQLAEDVSTALGGEITAARAQWEKKDSQVQAGLWTGQLTFTAGWADVPDIALPTSTSAGAPGVTWKVTANVQETNDGKAWYVTVRTHDQAAAKLRVNCSDRTFAGAKTITVVWNAVCK